jgi:hypothetical protein
MTFSQMGNSLRGNTGNKIPSGFNTGRIQNYTPEQMNLFQSLFSHVAPNSFTSQLAAGQPEAFEQVEGPALRQFNALQGNIASRFSGMGTGARRSSGFQNTMNAASSNFAQDLSSRRQELQRQALLDLMGISEQLLNQRPSEQFITPKKKSFLQSLLGGASSGIGALSGLFGL